MHLNTHDASLLVHRLQSHIKGHNNVEVVLAPSLLSLQPISLEIDRRRFRLAAQNAYFKDEGGFTGEVSFTMLRDLVHYCIIGHSERRIYFNEDQKMIRSKVSAAIRNEITPILCIGETKQEKQSGETKRVLHDQLTTAISDLTADEISDLVLAYEPVWAISNLGGEYAKPKDVEQVLKFIRYELTELYGEKIASHVRILYGGSVTPDTVKGYLSLPDCDGALVGGASLNYKSFAEIVESAYHQAN